MDDEQIVKYSVLLPKKAHKDLAQLALDRDVSMQEIARQALLDAITKPGPIPKTEQPAKPMRKSEQAYPYPEENRIWHDRLEVILANPKQRNGIEWNLSWGYNNITGKATKPATEARRSPSGQRRKVSNG